MPHKTTKNECPMSICPIPSCRLKNLMDVTKVTLEFLSFSHENDIHMKAWVDLCSYNVPR